MNKLNNGILGLNFSNILVFFFAFSLTACTTTPYSKALIFGGYQTKAMPGGLTKIMFFGNGDIDSALPEQYMLFKASEVTLESGHQYFKIYATVESSLEDKQVLVPQSTYVQGSHYSYVYIRTSMENEKGSLSAIKTLETLKNLIKEDK